MIQMTCSCGFQWESDSPKDCVDYHMMYHAGQSHLTHLEKGESAWHLTVEPNAYRIGFTLDN